MRFIPLYTRGSVLPRRGTNLMPSLIEFLKAKGSEEEEKRTNLIGVLREINNALQVRRALLPPTLMNLSCAKCCTAQSSG